MSTIYVAEYPGLAATDQEGSVPILSMPPTIEYKVVVSAGSSGAPQPLQASTKFVEISTDTTCSIAIAPTSGGAALVTNQRLNANERVIRRVPFQRQSFRTGVTGAVLTTAYSVFTTANV